jgi:hypothetical protein
VLSFAAVAVLSDADPVATGLAGVLGSLFPNAELMVSTAPRARTVAVVNPDSGTEAYADEDRGAGAQSRVWLSAGGVSSPSARRVCSARRAGPVSAVCGPVRPARTPVDGEYASGDPNSACLRGSCELRMMRLAEFHINM